MNAPTKIADPDVEAAQAASFPKIDRVSIVGAGLIGRSWAIVFARAGLAAKLYDPANGVGTSTLAHIKGSLEELAVHGLVNDPIAAFERITFEEDLAAAVADADWIQECAPENLQGKQRLFSQLDECAQADAIIASSTSGFRASSFTKHLAGRHRTLVAHPVNPPHLAPLVEIAPAPWTRPELATASRVFMERMGQKPILLRKEIDGFVLNRLQGAVLDEAFKLVEDGYVSVEDLDRAMVYGLAPRWSFMGPFETIDLNAPGGIKDYAERYGAMYHRFASDRSLDAKPWAPAAIAAVEADRRRSLSLDKIAERSSWRDRVLMRLAAERARLDRDEGNAS